ncbi:MAG: heavy metal translocating P-type ATPase [Myxococcales bacterium]|nr:heavy metal translocating P-type ATPase [Myxococcales bacterium]
MNKLKLDLPLVLPHDAEQADPCVHRLLIAVRGRPGVVDAHIDTTLDAQKPRLCVHFDAGTIAPSEVEKLVHAAGAELAEQYGHLRVSVRGVRHERHARVVEAALLRERGVLYAAVSFGTRRAAIEFDPRQIGEPQALEYLKRAGLQPGDPHEGHSHARDEHSDHKHGPGEHDGHKHGPGEHAHGGPFGERSELVFSVLCGVLTGAGWLLEGVTPPAVSMVLYALAYLFGGYFTVREAYEAIRAGRFEIDFLMLVAAGGAAALGEFAEGALLLFLFSFGHGLEGYAMSRARKAIAGLTELVPATAVKLTAGGEAVVPVANLAIGDRLLIKPNTRIPADGVVARGESSVDQAPITGESVPVDKRPHADPAAALAEPARIDPEHRVFAGTINGPGALEVLVTRVAADSTLARVVKLVTEAETQKSPTQQFTDRFERVFVPVILGLVVLLLFAWVVLPEPFSASFYRAMAVLVAASPCALAIATPSAVLAGVARAARGGVLVKGGAHLEALGSVGAIAFDKTGTLTEGKPRLTDVRPAQGVDVAQLLSIAGALERRSDHPLARAVVEGAEARLAVLPDATDVAAITGFGLRGRIDGTTVRIGKPGLFTRDGGTLPPPIQSLVSEVEGRGRTVMLVEFGGAFFGVLGVMDTPRPSARPVLERLRELGVGKTIMLTGDNQRVADAVAREVGITEARGDLLPEHKVEAVAELARSSSRVAMVGDGVNDAPALASATVGIAMGAGGSDVALETADVALMSDDLHGLPFAVGLSRSCRRVIRQNLWASLGMVAFLIPATLFGFAGIGAAVALHEGSTLVVVANALRLLAYRDPRTKH